MYGLDGGSRNDARQDMKGTRWMPGKGRLPRSNRWHFPTCSLPTPLLTIILVELLKLLSFQGLWQNQFLASNKLLWMPSNPLMLHPSGPSWMSAWPLIQKENSKDMNTYWFTFWKYLIIWLYTCHGNKSTGTCGSLNSLNFHTFNAKSWRTTDHKFYFPERWDRHKFRLFLHYPWIGKVAAAQHIIINCWHLFNTLTKISLNFEFSMLKSTLAWKKYTAADDNWWQRQYDTSVCV